MKQQTRINPALCVNENLLALVNKVEALQLTQFGSALGRLGSEDLVNAVVAHRIVNKFVPPADKDDAKRLHDVSVLKMVQHDLAGFRYEPAKAPAEVRSVIYKSKNMLEDWFRGFKPSYQFRAPTGESARSNAGCVDIMYKLVDTDHWEVSPGALPYATAICFNALYLKRLVREKFRTQEPTGIPWREQLKRWYVEEKSSEGKGHIGYRIFGKMFASLCTLNNVCRVTTIPKDRKSRRVITMVPFWNMVCQLSLMYDMRNHIKSRLGYDLNNRASLHKTLIRHRRFATIDLSRASDSIWQDVVDFHYPQKLRKLFAALVDKHYEYELDGNVEYGYFNMFSPMGNGLTFDVMTLLLLAIGRCISPAASVFGDDIMIPQDGAEVMVKCIGAVGLIVNEDKSFLEGSFSESCGGYYDHAGRRDIVSYDFLYANDAVSAFAVANKLLAIIQAGQVTGALRAAIVETHQRILSKLDRFAVDPAILPVLTHPHIESGFLLGEGPVRKQSVVSREVGKKYNRKIVPCYIRRKVSLTTKMEKGIGTYASWFLRNASYQPNTADVKMYNTLCDAWSGNPLAEELLVSFIG